MITCVPEVKKMQLTPETKFIVIACDGIWDCLTSQECCDLLAQKIKARGKNVKSTATVVEEMFDEIICKDVNDPSSDGSGTDNMTCILIEIKK